MMTTCLPASQPPISLQTTFIIVIFFAMPWVTQSTEKWYYTIDNCQIFQHLQNFHLVLIYRCFVYFYTFFFAFCMSFLVEITISTRKFQKHFYAFFVQLNIFTCFRENSGIPKQQLAADRFCYHKERKQRSKIIKLPPLLLLRNDAAVELSNWLYVACCRWFLYTKTKCIFFENFHNLFKKLNTSSYLLVGK